MDLKFDCSNLSLWKEALSSYQSRIESLDKPKLLSLEEFYRDKLPSLIHQRNPKPYITTSELSQLMQWKLTRGKWRYSRSLSLYMPRLLDFVSALDEELVKSSSQKAFEALPDISKAVNELTVLKGVGPATASAILAAYAPHLMPFMSDEAMEAALVNSKDYSLKRYLLFASKLQTKAEELSSEGNVFTPSDVERALWSAAMGAKLRSSQSDTSINKNTKRRRKC